MFNLLSPYKCFRMLVCACMCHHIMIIFPFLNKFFFFLELIIVLFAWVSECFPLISPTLYLSCRNFLSVYANTLCILLTRSFGKASSAWLLHCQLGSSSPLFWEPLCSFTFWGHLFPGFYVFCLFTPLFW